MFAWLQSQLQSHPLGVLVLAVLLLGAVASLLRAGALALHAWRMKQTAAADGLAEQAKLAAVDALTALVAQVVLSYEGQVRDLKDPGKPGVGQWNPLTDGPRILQAVVGDVWTLGGATLATLRARQGLTVAQTTELLAKIAEAQVQKLRAVPQPLPPAELAGLVAEILRDPTTAPASPRETLPSLADALGAARVLVNGDGVSVVADATAPFDPSKRQPIAPAVVEAARALTGASKGSTRVVVLLVIAGLGLVATIVAVLAAAVTD